MYTIISMNGYGLIEIVLDRSLASDRPSRARWREPVGKQGTRGVMPSFSNIEILRAHQCTDSGVYVSEQ